MSFDVGAAVAHIKADLTGFKQGIAEAKQEANGFTSTLGNIGSGIANFGAQAAVLTGVVGAGLALTAKIGLDSAAKFEQYQIAYTTLLGSQKAASAAIKDIQDDAAKTPFELAPLVMANQRLISAGINAGQARKDILNLGDAISATGGGNAELERLSTNLQQIKAVGKASALDIKQFAFAGINVYDMLAKSTGKSVEEVKNMDVSYEVLSKSFEMAAAKGGKFHDAMKNQSTTLNGLMSTLHDVVTLGLKDILMDSGIFDVIRNAVSSLIPFLEGTLVPGIVRFFQVLSGGFGLLQEVISGDNVMPEVREFLSYFMGGEMPSENHPAVKFFYALANVFKVVGDWIMANQELVITFLKGLGIALGVLLIVGTITMLITALMNPLVLVALAIAALYTAWQTNFLGFRDITTAVVTEVIHFFNDYLMPAIQALVAYWQEIWPYVSQILQGYWNIMLGIIQVAWALIYGLIKIGLALLSGDWGRVWQAITEMVSSAWEGIKRIFGGIISYISGWGGWLFDSLTKPFRDAWDTISNLVNKIKDALDFTKRHSPSVVDIVEHGVGLVNRALGDLTMGIDPVSPTIGMGALPNTGSGLINNIGVTVSLDGAIIADEQSAQRMSEMVGNSIIKKLQQNVRF